MTTIEKLIKNRKKILGLNERYLSYMRPNNLSRSIEIADDKALTKRILKKHNIPTPNKIGLIKSYRELGRFDFNSLPASFVIKPVRGVRGGGVEVFYNRDNQGNWIRSDGSRVDVNYIKARAREILDGRYSLFFVPDSVLFEERVRPHKTFKYYTYKGTPDVRVIVYNNIPVMSFVRLPTRESKGRANLDQGAIGAGIDMAVGKTTHAIIGKSQDIDFVPDYKLPLSGLRIPFWDRILRYSVEASQATKLGYAAIDFLIDKEKGPVVVELNARPGLSIQLSNYDGLRWRLKKAGGIKVKTVEKGVRLAKDLFGGEIEEDIEIISGKQVLGLIENVKILGQDSKAEEVKAKIDTGASLSSMDIELAKRLGFEDAINFANNILENVPKVFDTTEEAKAYSLEHNLNQKLEEHSDINGTAIIKAGNGVTYRISINISFEISGTLVETHVTLTNRRNLNYAMIIGEKDLKKFLIDPAKK